MDKFQIVEITEQLNHAGTKAAADVAVIAERLGFTRVNIKMETTEESAVGKAKRQIGYFRDWRKAEQIITNDSVLLLQHPFHHKQLTRENTLKRIKTNKNVKIISVVHDVEELRAFRYNDYYKHEFDFMLDIADVLIVHNEVMKQWFIGRGVDEKKLVSLEIFDYLQNTDPDKEIKFEISITIAGNLDTQKCGYIRQLGSLSGIKIHLYGPNFDDSLRSFENIEYHGSFPVDEIPNKLDRGFGLVWDGDSIDGCQGQSGQYLRYNNPHKLSLYLSSGLPVVIWKNAAEAEFVKKHGVGILVESLNELSNEFEKIDKALFNRILNNIAQEKYKLCDGHFFEKAIQKTLEIIVSGN